VLGFRRAAGNGKSRRSRVLNPGARAVRRLPDARSPRWLTHGRNDFRLRLRCRRRSVVDAALCARCISRVRHCASGWRSAALRAIGAIRGCRVRRGRARNCESETQHACACTRVGAALVGSTDSGSTSPDSQGARRPRRRTRAGNVDRARPRRGVERSESWLRGSETPLASARPRPSRCGWCESQVHPGIVGRWRSDKRRARARRVGSREVRGWASTAERSASAVEARRPEFAREREASRSASRAPTTREPTPGRPRPCPRRDSP